MLRKSQSMNIGASTSCPSFTPITQGNITKRSNKSTNNNEKYPPPKSSSNSTMQRTTSADDLALVERLDESPPINQLSDARLLYRSWRTGSHLGIDPLILEGTSPSTGISVSPHTNKFIKISPPSWATLPKRGQSLPLTHSNSTGETLPAIAEKMANENTPLFANSSDPDLNARLLSEQIIAQDLAREAAQDLSDTNGSGSDSQNIDVSSPTSSKTSSVQMKKARSYQTLDKLDAQYFPAQPSARGVQRGLKDSVINDMCRAVVKHMVGDVYVLSSSHLGTTKVLNHLYAPVLASVQAHFRRLPARYALSVDPDEVPTHMRLLGQHSRSPKEITVHVQLKKDDDGNIVPNVCEVVIVSTDRDMVLDAITRALTSMRGSIMDADVMSTLDGITLDRFVVRGQFMTQERQQELRDLVAENLELLSSDGMQSDPAGGDFATQNDSEKLAQRQNVLDLAGKNEVRPDWMLNMAEIKLDATIGSGRSGNTYRAWWRGTEVAAKVVDSSGSIGEELLNEFHREVAVVSKLRHPNIVLFLGAAINPPRYCLVFEFMSNGTLTDVIRQRKNPLDFFRIAKEIAMGMNYLHHCSIMHRDLKSGNILIDCHNTVKISDFGLSCVLDIGVSSNDLTAETGTYRWMAPEVIRHEPYSNKADVYSYGVVLWEMITRDQPFRGMTPIQAAFAVARQQMRPALPRQTPLKIGELVEHCWHHDPEHRPDFQSILKALPLVQRSLKKRECKNLNFTVP